MQVRSSSPAWTALTTAHFSSAKPITNDLEAEVVVVGAGVSGALTAHELARHGADVVVLDRAQPAAGSTAACTALIQYELDEPLTAVAKLHSLDHAQRAYQTSREALDWLDAHVQSLRDDCDLHRRETIQIATKRRDLKEMKREFEARRDAGIDVEWVEADELEAEYHIARDGAIRSLQSMELHPYRLAVATLESAVRLGACVYVPAEVAHYDFDDAGVTLALEHGPKVRGRKVVVANGYQTPSFLREGYGRLLSTWAVASEPIDLDEHWQRRQLLWEWGRPYLYARSMPDGRLIFGGLDEPFTNATVRDALIPAKTDKLVKQMSQLLPGLELKPAFSWAGTFAETKDAMPYIGPHPDYPNTLMALGYGGNGVTFSMIAARIITGLVCDKQALRAPLDLFRFER